MDRELPRLRLYETWLEWAPTLARISATAAIVAVYWSASGASALLVLGLIALVWCVGR